MDDSRARDRARVSSDREKEGGGESSEFAGKFDERRNGQFILSRVRLAIMASFAEVCSLKWP